MKRSTSDSLAGMDRLLTRRIEISSEKISDKILTLDSNLRGVVDSKAEIVSASLLKELEATSSKLEGKITVAGNALDSTMRSVSQLDAGLKGTVKELEIVIQGLDESIPGRVERIIEKKSFLARLKTVADQSLSSTRGESRPHTHG